MKVRDQSQLHLPSCSNVAVQQSDPILPVVDHQDTRNDDMAGSEADQKDIKLLLDPGLDEAYDVASWPLLNKGSDAGQQAGDQQQPRSPEDIPATTQTSPLARHLQSTGDALPPFQRSSNAQLVYA